MGMPDPSSFDLQHYLGPLSGALASLVLVRTSGWKESLINFIVGFFAAVWLAPLFAHLVGIPTEYLGGAGFFVGCLVLVILRAIVGFLTQFRDNPLKILEAIRGKK